MLLKDESQHQDSRKKNKVRLQTLQILHGNLNIVFPTDIKQDNFMLDVDT